MLTVSAEDELRHLFQTGEDEYIKNILSNIIDKKNYRLKIFYFYYLGRITLKIFSAVSYNISIIIFFSKNRPM